MTPIDPAIFANLAADLGVAEEALAAADVAYRDATNRRSAAQKARDSRRDALRQYVEKCAGAKIALLP